MAGPITWTLERLNALTEGDAQPNWRTLKRLVYERDDGICWVCGQWVPPAFYELGHLVDRVAGGPDTADNVVVMCIRCNRVVKPVFDTLEEAIAWKATDPFKAFLDEVLSDFTEIIEKANKEEATGWSKDYLEWGHDLLRQWTTEAMWLKDHHAAHGYGHRSVLVDGFRLWYSALTRRSVLANRRVWLTR